MFLPHDSMNDKMVTAKSAHFIGPRITNIAKTASMRKSAPT